MHCWLLQNDVQDSRYCQKQITVAKITLKNCGFVLYSVDVRSSKSSGVKITTDNQSLCHLNMNRECHFWTSSLTTVSLSWTLITNWFDASLDNKQQSELEQSDIFMEGSASLPFMQRATPYRCMVSGQQQLVGRWDCMSHTKGSDTQKTLRLHMECHLQNSLKMCIFSSLANGTALAPGRCIMSIHYCIGSAYHNTS